MLAGASAHPLYLKYRAQLEDNPGNNPWDADFLKPRKKSPYLGTRSPLIHEADAWLDLLRKGEMKMEVHRGFEKLSLIKKLYPEGSKIDLVRLKFLRQVCENQAPFLLM